MKLIKFIVERKILVGLVAVLVLLTGSYAVLELDKELMPAMKMDGGYAEINAGEMPAIEIERSITTPLEQQLKGLDGVEDVTSTTIAGRSSIQMAFEQGRGDEVFKEVESVINSSTAGISAVKEVEMGQYGASQSYEFFLDLSNGNLEDITRFAKETLEPRLEALPEVRDVSLSGMEEDEVNILLNREEMLKKGLDAAGVMAAIQQVNSEATLGQLKLEKESPSVRWNTKPGSENDIRNIEIASPSGFIKLGDIADITVAPQESSSFVWKNGTKDLVFVQVGRVSDATQIEMADAVRGEIEKIREEGLIKGFELNEMVAQADYVQESIDGVASNILIGGIIAVVILLLFLRNLRATLIVGISIPTSVLLTFASMWMFGYSLNMLTLIGLGLGIGMMVDSSIVILESIYRKKEQGLARLEAVLEGTKEVSAAVIASMLTTIVVFLPIGLLGGEMGQFMIILSAVVAITLISSVLVSFTVIPTLSEKFLKISSKKKARREGPLLRFYSRVINWTVKKKRHSFAVIAAFFLMFAGSLLLIPKIPMTIMPDVFNRYSELMVDLETGVSIKEKEAVAAEMNESLSKIKDVESNYVMDSGGMMYTIINMTKGDDITKSQKEVNEEIMKALRELEDTQPIESVQSVMSGGGGYPVQVNLKGESFEELETVSDSFIKELGKIDGIVAITSSMKRTSPEEIVELKEDEIQKAGLSGLQVKQFIEQSFMEMPLGEVSLHEESVPLILGWSEKTATKEALIKLSIPAAGGEKKLSELISLRKIDAPNEISHKDGERFISISADIEDRDLGSINRDVQKLIEKFDAPAGYTLSAAGDLEQQQELIKDMVFILSISIFLVYLVMAVQFNHLVQPIIVMSVIPMTIVGVILGLFLTQRELSVMSAMGIVMLIGIVLNNAILLLDRTNQLRKEGAAITDALIQAGKDRIRPIFMTTLTTAGGMLPLALASGTSGNYQAPMATVLISGLMFATFITLLLIPAVYRLFSRSPKKTKEQPEPVMENAS
ncbi:efflux RND transporter permease subunit [Bacillus infantis]|uniref:efflux RND transporter permease subunit n=1 Tax=Bacillus infantis TaxID=324767 RepID=UPI001CD4BA5B|nr:efflux RND transporter permease subunit [Bacillus infantis]MCA1035978.1 efflux RND transporter permease subunit [Bacillus infantis]